MCTGTCVQCIHMYLYLFLKCQVTKLQTAIGVSHSLHFFKSVLHPSLVLTQSTSSSGFLADAPWLFYQDAEYLFHTHAAEWDAFEFVCGWLRSDFLTIYSTQEQEFIHSKIRVVLEHKSLQEIHSLHLLLSYGEEIFSKFDFTHSFMFP